MRTYLALSCLVWTLFVCLPIASQAASGKGIGKLVLKGVDLVVSQSRPWKKVASFAFQLQQLDLNKLAQSNFDLIVIDYSADGSAAKRFGQAQIQALQKGPRGRRLVLCYLSIGEAEEYRFYWKKGFKPGNPLWLDQLNRAWKGNYKVRYWDPAWQRILFGSPEAYLDQIIAAGFDGVYLDIVDGYEFYESQGDKRARPRMLELVKKLAIYARQKGGADFGIFPQNGEELLIDPGYLKVVTGVGKEETYFGYEGDGKASPTATTLYVESLLSRAVKAGKLVLTIDYTDKKTDIRLAHSRAHRQGYREYIAPRALDGLRIYPGIQPRLDDAADTPK